MISVLLTVYNEHESLIKRALKSVIVQFPSGFGEVEILIIDDGSDKKTNDFLYKFSGTVVDELKKDNVQFKSYDKTIKVLTKENGGVASALNYGIEKSSGDYIAWLPADDMWLYHKLYSQFKYCKDWIFGGSLDVVSPEYCRSYGEHYFNEIGVYSFFDWATLRNKLKKVYEKFKLQTNIINGTTCLWKRSMHDKVGMFDENLKYLNDLDMWVKFVYSDFKPSVFGDVVAIKQCLNKNEGGLNVQLNAERNTIYERMQKLQKE